MASKENPVDSSAVSGCRAKLQESSLGEQIQEDSTHDHRIFTLATLLCSTLVYNMKGAFDQEAVNKLTRDVDMIRQKYEQVLREYAQGEITMIWNDFENGLGMETIQILKNDPALSEEEKQTSLEKNQEELNRILDQINDLNEKRRIHWEEENQLLKNEVKHFAEWIAALEKKEEKRKANGFHAINTEDRKKVKLRNMLKKTRITFEYIKENDKN
ncbi:hypothetical protein MAR_004048 [Mya arenaria]|uniref:Guanylate-binding protein N-terminal domain-containing protein n=1 Tax=Mya arenaria TaxID=6604 RepID=A0ABY7EZL8_MYAAR|nr:hypothetical protein MAR_004048 [Mya arenaria]